MSKVNVALLPGIFGTRLALPSGVPGLAGDVFPPNPVTTVGLMLQMELASDGLSPGPHTWGWPLIPAGVWEFQYSPLRNFMAGRGWNVLECPYDWRLSLRQSAPAILAAVQAAFGQQPFAFVAHSMGGLAARAVYALMVNQGIGQQLAGLVTLGAPHFGSWEPARGFFGLPFLYQALQWFAYLSLLATPAIRTDYLDLLIASWPGWYELLPWRDAGPLAIADPATAQALYNPQTYVGGNPYIKPALLAAAVQTQHYLAPAIPFGLVVTILGSGFVTTFEVNPPSPLWTPSGYLYNGDGDGYVPLSYGMLPSAIVVKRPVSHGDLARDPRAFNAVAWGVQQFFGPGA